MPVILTVTACRVAPMLVVGSGNLPVCLIKEAYHGDRSRWFPHQIAGRDYSESVNGTLVSLSEQAGAGTDAGALRGAARCGNMGASRMRRQRTGAPCHEKTKMPTPLLQTKLTRPPVRPEAVPRPRLVARLDEGLRLGQRLALISAPAGFGKTTLVSAWVRGAGLTAAWLSLDSGDNDPVRFLAYVVAALQKVDGDLGRGIEAGLHSGPMLPVEELLTPLVNQLAARQDPCLLVLDDYHTVTAQPVHDALAFLLEHLPLNVHLVIVTRADPPLPVARLRARGQVTELRQRDLRFGAGEAAEFFNGTMGLALEAGDVLLLEGRTEGWVAGLQMAALSMRGEEDASGFVQSFTGSDRYILDYLLEEVLQRQPEEIQTFLLRTAILERLSAPLSDAVRFGRAEPPSSSEATAVRFGRAEPRSSSEATAVRFGRAEPRSSSEATAVRFGRAEPPSRSERPAVAGDLGARSARSSQAILEYLEASNLFVEPLDTRREWYRYHRLFADLLRSRLQAEMPGLVPELHRRASDWYEEAGYDAQAIEHALAAGEPERAACLVERAAEPALMRSELATFQRWVEALPGELVRTRPLLCVYHAGALLWGGFPLDAVEGRLRDADEADPEGEVAGEVAVFRALIALLQGDAQRSAELSQRTLERLPEERGFLRGIAADNLGVAHLADGDSEAAMEAFEAVARESCAAGNPMVAARALCHLAEVHVREGRLRRAREVYEEALALAIDGEGRRLPAAGRAMMEMGELWREWNQLARAERLVTEGIELNRRYGEAGALGGYLSLARIRLAQGDAAGAREAVRQAAEIARRFDATEMDDWIVAMSGAWLSVKEGDLEEAERWVEARGLDRVPGPEGTGASGIPYSDRLRKYELPVAVRLRLAQGRPDEALALLGRLHPLVERRGPAKRLIELPMLTALALSAQGDLDGALANLEQALALAEPEGYGRLFLDEGEPMAVLLAALAARGTRHGAYVAMLRGAFAAQPPAAPGAQPDGLVESLSARELEVLRLLAEGLSNQEIAHELVIAVGTVKNHLKNVYGKLGVHSRTQAVVRAREAGLL
jgi:LuxR family maltose regulon positive regulatory protein